MFTAGACFKQASIWQPWVEFFKSFDSILEELKFNLKLSRHVISKSADLLPTRENFADLPDAVISLFRFFAERIKDFFKNKLFIWIHKYTQILCAEITDSKGLTGAFSSPAISIGQQNLYTQIQNYKGN